MRCTRGLPGRLHLPSNRDSFAFSLLELLIVVGLLLLLTTLYWGSGTPNRQKQLKTACQQNFEKLYIAMQIYANDNASAFPNRRGAGTSAEALDALVPRYTSDTSLFLCPGSKDAPLAAGEPFRSWKLSYAYYMGRNLTNGGALMSDKQVDTRAKVAGQDTFSSDGKPPGNNHGKSGGNFLFGDGHVEQTGPSPPFALPLSPGTVLLNP
jgi:prepilin-type processing-associated H-X9-DG protein